MARMVFRIFAKVEMNTFSIRTCPIIFFFFTAPVSVCTIVLPNVEIVTLLSSLLLMLFFSKSIIKIDNYSKHVLLLFFFPILISTLFACFQIVLKNDLYYYEYFQYDLPGRIFHVFSYLFIFTYVHAYLKVDSGIRINILKTYTWGIVLILGLFGFWQLLGNFGIWCPDVETRDSLYFARNLGISRITSIASEPSYLVPFLLDGILISVFLRKKVISIFLAIVLLFSLSFGAYMEIIILTFSYFILSTTRQRTIFFTIIGIVILIVILMFPEFISLAIEIINSRQELQSGFDVRDTSRTAMIAYPIMVLFHSDILTIFFGNGPSSFKFLNASDDDAIFSTSNNIYVDLLYEGGIVSFLCLILLAVYFWRLISSLKVTNSLDKLLVKLFLIHIALSSFYRADYASERFTVLLLIVYIFYLILRQNYAIAHQNRNYKKDD